MKRNVTKIRRFPRLLKDYPDAPLTKNMKVAMQLAEDKIPRGYNILTYKMKRLARKVVDGMSVKDACRTMHMDTNTFYRYMHYHPRFKKYYLEYAKATVAHIGDRFEAKLGRAVRLVEDALDNDDPYFAHESAVKLYRSAGFEPNRQLVMVTTDTR